MSADLTINGYDVLKNIYSPEEVEKMLRLIESRKDTSGNNFRISRELYAIRNLLHELPELATLIINEKLKRVLDRNFLDPCFIVKGIYFDKPPQSSWTVNWHQDLMISVNNKMNL